MLDVLSNVDDVTDYVKKVVRNNKIDFNRIRKVVQREKERKMLYDDPPVVSNEVDVPDDDQN